MDPFLKIKDQTLNIATWFSPTGETKSAHTLQDSKEAQNEVIQEISAQRKNTTIEDFTSELVSIFGLIIDFFSANNLLSMHYAVYMFLTHQLER